MGQNNLETAESTSSKRAERPETRETAPDAAYEQAVQGAQILEDASSGFVHALQTFVSWVNNLLGKSKP